MANDVADLLLKIDATTEGLRRELKKAEDSVNKGSAQIDKSTKQIDKSFQSMGDNVKKVVGGIVAAVGAIQIGKKFADIIVETEKLKGSLTTITGSADLAGKAFDKLTEFASQTPFTLDQSVNAFIKLKALGLDPSERAMLSYGNTASAMGKDMMQMIEAVADASTGEFERLKEFGIKAKSEGDNVSLTFQGVTTTIGKNSEEIQGYLLAIGETQFAGAMEDQMERLPGLLSNLQDNIDGLFRKMGDTGGIGLFGGAITAASGAIVYLTDNLDVVATAASAFGAALGVLIGPAAIVGGINMIRNAALALNAAFLANPIAMIVAAMAAAAVVIYRHWDEITVAAEKSAVHVEIAWNKLKLFLLDSFAPALDTISGLFADVQDNAVATWTAIAAAAKDPLNAIDTFNATFDTTLQRLKDGREGSNTFADSVQATKERIAALEGKLVAMNTTVEAVDESVGDADFSLSQFKTEVNETATATGDLDEKGRDLVNTLSNELEAFDLSNLELAIRNNLQKAGVDSTSELGQEIIALTTQIHNEKEAMTAAATEAKALEKANDEAARAAEEAWGRTHDYLSATFIDIFDNGDSAFKNMADSFTAMIKRMVAEWAASGLMKLFGFGGTASSGAGNPLSGLFGGGGSGGQSGGGSILSLLSSGFGLAGAGSKIGAGAAALMTNPWTYAVGGLLYGASQDFWKDPDGYTRSSAGMLTAPTSGVKPGQTFQVDAFDSGFKPIGFKDKKTIAEANEAIDIFRQLDSELFSLLTAAGGKSSLGNATLAGFGEDGVSGTSGTFLGVGGKSTEADLAAMLNSYALQFVKHVEGLTPQVTAQLMGANSIGDITRILQENTESAETAADASEDASESSDALAKIMDHMPASMRQEIEAAFRELDGITEINGMLFDSNGNLVDSNGVLISSNAELASVMASLPKSIQDIITAGMSGSASTVAAAASTVAAAASTAAAYVPSPSKSVQNLKIAYPNMLMGEVHRIMENMKNPFNLTDKSMATGLDAVPNIYLDGSHRSGLKRVPFDGYVAELHKNEEVLTENDPRNSNNGMGSMGMMNEMRKIAESVKKTADLLTRVTRDGNSLVTEPA
jgi:hypothetical protein